MSSLKDFRFCMKCIDCGKEHVIDQPHYTCTACNGLLMPDRDMDFLKKMFPRRVIFQNHYSSLALKESQYPFGSRVWRYAEIIMPGFNPKDAISLNEGRNDFWEAPEWFSEKIGGLKRVYIKMKGQNPSESFKDEGMTVAVSFTRWLQKAFPDLGISCLVCASTGDTSASLAIYTAYAGPTLRCIVLLPNNNVQPGQLAQAIDFGALVLALDSPEKFDGCMKVVAALAQAHPEMVLANSKNPFRIMGQQADALATFQYFGYQAPDCIVMPCGNGGNIASQMSGWLLLKELGLLDKLPRIVIAQTKAADTLVRWLKTDAYQPGEPKDTVASAMNIQAPVSFPRIKKLTPQFEVYGSAVHEQDIADTRALFSQAGAPVCPQGAVACHGMLQATADGFIQENDLVVVHSTASSLKFADASIGYHRTAGGQYANPYQIIPATLADVEQAVAAHLS